MLHNRIIRLICVLGLLWVAPPLMAQVLPVPSVPPLGERYPGRLVSHPDSAANLLQKPGEAGLFQVPQAPMGAGQPYGAGLLTSPPAQTGAGMPAQPQPPLPPGVRPGMFQRLIFEGTWLPWDGGDNVGMSDLELKSVFALPLPSRQLPLVITPGFAVHYLDGPVSADLPPQVYDVYTQFRWLGAVTPRFGVDLAVTPGLYTDFEHWSDDALRVTGHGAATWVATANFQIVLGAAYIDRRSADVLPIAGFIWTPNEDTRFELVFPNPRIAERLYWHSACTSEVQDWVYIGAELGGGTWVVEHVNALEDRIDYRDYRVFVGLERKATGCVGSRLEIGYVFARKLQFESGLADIEPQDTVMLRGGLTY